MANAVLNYLRPGKFPNIWCAGCGNGIIMGALIRAIDRVKRLNKDNVVVVSGIGCSARASGYLDFNTLHTTHGRAIPFATGIKLANPNLNVFVLTGDGDCTAIGGNHLIHAARRNLDLNVIVFNNGIYGMTGGQASPTTPYEGYATTAPYGSIEHNFEICKLAAGAGATYVARSTSYHVHLLTRLIMRGIMNKGFSLIEVITHCYTNFGRLNGFSSPVEMLKWQRDRAIKVKDGEVIPDEELDGKFAIGEFVNDPDKPEFTEEYEKKIIARAKELAGLEPKKMKRGRSKEAKL
jgi:2-oxoglutarate ferredoxin oxidoreductase subunit beta